MKKAFKTVVAFPKTVLTLSIIICLFFGYFTTKLEIDASTQTLLLENDRELFVYREVSKRYETPNFLVAAYTPNNDLLSDKTLEKIKIISDELEKINGVISVFSILNAPLLQNSNVPLSDLIKHIPNLMDKDINKTAAKNE
ncbi:TPA: RND family transporter, partial [Campylobacter fetus subsp. venerealis]|nr:RND family transporter [Campylobacter fetus subsp. venerealis]